ncbi:MAG: N6-L-threonylcarbamoyladenine synthase [Limisphaerales bacterium]|jgi:N6-L-threonylcarbamoyladenine synthase
MSTVILGIESSCDDTSAAIYKDGKILANLIAGQQIHSEYGGVVPELASRAHQKNIVPVVDQALKAAGVSKEEVDAVAYTKGPGLLGSLLVGSSFAKGFAMAQGIPIIGVHHMKAHVLAHFIEDPKPTFPFLCLTVSGGHTQIVQVNGPLEMEILGQTIDDAAGEAFDKTAKLIGLEYPGGPLIDKFAKSGDPLRFEFARPKVDGLNFSFSGLKTSVLYFVQKAVKANPDFVQQNLEDLCASVQFAIISMLVRNLKLAVKQTGITQVAIAGGVSANSGLRNTLEQTAKVENWTTFIPAFEYCTDNAAMIAITGWFMFEAGQFDTMDASPSARMAW